MINTKDFYDYLLEENMDFFSGVPDSLLTNFCACIKQNAPKEKNIIAANEGNAVAICAGYHISTGKYGVVYMQNSGEGNAVNPLLSLADEEVYSIPMLLLIGWRGEPGVHDEPQHVKQGKVTIPLLETMDISYALLQDDFETQIKQAKKHMEVYGKPYALIIKKGVFSSYGIEKETPKYSMTREEALESILSCIKIDEFTVSTTGKTSREIFELREKMNQDHSSDFLTVGSMGHTASIAFGMTLGTEKNVWCIDGDGSFIMHMGSLGVIGANMPANFKYILNDNAAHESVGGQPTCSNSLDIPLILKGCGFQKVFIAQTQEEIVKYMDALRNEKGVALILKTKQGSRSDLGRPTISPKENKNSLMKKIGSI